MEEKDPISHIAHAIRTPLTVIMSTINNLIDGAFGKVPANQSKWLRKVDAHTKHLESLLNDILKIIHERPDVTAASIQKVVVGSAKETTPVIPGDALLAEKMKTARIVVVDDEQDILDVMKTGLSDHGFHIKTFSKGQEAKNYILSHPCDLILMDVHLSDMNGIELCKILKSELRHFIPIILVTGQNDLRDQLSKKSPEVDDVLMKPFLMEELLARVASMLKMKSLNDQLAAFKKKAA